MDQLHRIDLTKLYQPFARKLQVLVDRCRERGALYLATSGVRTFDEQDALYAIGRTTGRTGHTVTKAKGGQSPHNFAVACDLSYCTQLEPKVIIDDAEKNYRILAEEATKLGLVSGLTWKSSFVDPNHVQWPVKQIGYSWGDLTAAYRKGGYQGLFKVLDDWQAKNGTI